MASPQVEKGYTRVANEILDNIMKANLNGTQFRIVMAIWRYTYGFKRTEYGMSISFLSKTINGSRGQVDRELSALITRNIILSTGADQKGARMLSFNKDYEEWDNQSEKRKGSLVKEEQPVKPKKKAKAAKYTEDNTYMKMAMYFHGLVSAVAKDAGVEHLIAKANMQSWADDFRKLIEKDGVDKRLAKQVMDWVTQDSFWRTNVLSAKKLREKFGELAIKMKAANTPKQPVKQRPLANDIRDKEIEFNRFVSEGGNPDDFDWTR